MLNVLKNDIKFHALFQAQLEAEIENLSWKIERAETTERDRGDIENQMDVVEKMRMILLKDFFPTTSSSFWNRRLGIL